MSPQCEAILAHLGAGHSLTPLEALDKFGTLRLSERIRELEKAGYQITHEMVKVGAKRVCQYTLADDGIMAEQESNYNRMIGESLRR